MPKEVGQQRAEDIVTEGLNSVYDELMKLDDYLSEQDFIEFVTEAAREYAKICVTEGQHDF